jgi:hypothetical protein
MEIWKFNDEFVEAGEGMPLWKDASGLLSGHGRLWAYHPCRTSVVGTKGGRWTIDWTQTRGTSFKGQIEFVGKIVAHHRNKSSNVFGFFEFEGASRDLNRSRRNFAAMKSAADDLYLYCSVLRAP